MNWDDLRAWWRRSLYNNQQLVLAWSKPNLQPPQEIWLTLVGIAKYLSRTNQLATRTQILEKLKISDRSLLLGIKALKYWGFTVTRQDRSLQFIWSSNSVVESNADAAIAEFLATISEEQFQQKYFAEVPLSTIVAMVNRV